MAGQFLLMPFPAVCAVGTWGTFEQPTTRGPQRNKSLVPYSKQRLPGEYDTFVSITLTGLKNPTEVRVFEHGTTTEVSGTGAENVTSGSHSFNIGLGQQVDIAILSLGYQNTRLLNFSSTVSTNVPIQQIIDRQYENPA